MSEANFPKRTFAFEVYCQKLDFLRATQAQLGKDFSKVNSAYALVFEEKVDTLDQLVVQVNNCLIEQMSIGERALLQLLYTIDLPEKEFLQLLGLPDFSNQMTTRVIRREAYKVWIKQNFS